MKPTYLSILLKVWQRLVQVVLWKHRKRAQFCHACTHPPMQMINKISGVTGPKFTKFLPDVEESSPMLSKQFALQFVHPSKVGVVAKRLNIESRKQCCTIATDSSFIMWCKRSLRNSEKCRWVGKIAFFDRSRGLRLRRLTAENLCMFIRHGRERPRCAGGVIRGVTNNSGGSWIWWSQLATVPLTSTRFVVCWWHPRHRMLVMR